MRKLSTHYPQSNHSVAKSQIVLCINKSTSQTIKLVSAFTPAFQKQYFSLNFLCFQKSKREMIQLIFRSQYLRNRPDTFYNIYNIYMNDPLHNARVSGSRRALSMQNLTLFQEKLFPNVDLIGHNGASIFLNYIKVGL